MTVAADCDPVQQAGGWRAVRRLPTPVCEPPYDDERDERAAQATAAHAGQGALALAFTLPGGLPALPTLRLVPTPEAEPEELSFEPQRTARAALPDPQHFAGRLVQAVVEVAIGSRPAAQLVRWTSSDVYADLNSRVRRAARSDPLGRRKPAARVRSVHVSEPSDGVLEVCALVQREDRATAVAMRLDGVDGRWQCTALTFG
jgi:hypothetical protein